MMTRSQKIAANRRDTVEVTGTSAQAQAGTIYVANNAALVTITLPVTAKVGDEITVIGKGAGGWRIGQNAGQAISHLTTNTTTGTGGSLSSGALRDAVTLVCTTENTTWTTKTVKGTLTVA
ncbi:MAG TPA: hypothetical protein DIS79_06335 [Bacteroidetes bacterium]|nr:hypothetical protein [Bacteroidota bacterium]HRK04082.1 hypothetical protein [Chlorobiota bacterium]